MKNWQRNGILTVALLAFGAARLPFEAGFARELRAAGMSPPPPEIGTIDKIDQTSAAVVLGGLRTLVATFLDLRALTFFEEQKWDKVAETYNTIVTLAPQTTYYWDNGMWHSAYNAASDYLYNSDLPTLRRREAWRASIYRGRAFLERGIRNNPDDPTLLVSLGDLLADKNKFPAFGNPDQTFAESADAYRRAVATGKAIGYVRRAQFYSLARVPGKEKEALALGQELYANPKNRVPTLLLLRLILEAHENPAKDVAAGAVEGFGAPAKAYESLKTHWLRGHERFPEDGVAAALESLEKQLGIPAAQSILNQPPRPPSGPDEWFKK